MSPLGLFLLTGGLVLFLLAWVAYQRRRVMADTPTSKIRSMAIGLVELNGVAEPLAGVPPLVARFTAQPCLFWKYELEEERERTVTHTQNGRTETRVERYWETIDRGEQRAPFAIRDE